MVRVDVRVVEDKQEVEEVEVSDGDGDHFDCQCKVSYLLGVLSAAS
jgi:hypothetical protein